MTTPARTAKSSENAADDEGACETGGCEGSGFVELDGLHEHALSPTSMTADAAMVTRTADRGLRNLYIGYCPNSERPMAGSMELARLDILRDRERNDHRMPRDGLLPGGSRVTAPAPTTKSSENAADDEGGGAIVG